MGHHVKQLVGEVNMKTGVEMSEIMRLNKLIKNSKNRTLEPRRPIMGTIP